MIVLEIAVLALTFNLGFGHDFPAKTDLECTSPQLISTLAEQASEIENEEIPDLIGKTPEEALAIMEGLGFYVAEEPSGIENEEIPDLIGKTQEEVSEIMEGLGFTAWGEN